LIESDIPIIVSGGIRDSNDLEKIKNLNNKSIFGVILGKSLYENTIDLEESLKVYQDVS